MQWILVSVVLMKYVLFDAQLIFYQVLIKRTLAKEKYLAP